VKLSTSAWIGIAVLAASLGSLAVPARTQEAPPPAARKVAPPPASADGVSLPEKVEVAPGRLAKVQATSAGKTVRWINPHPQVDVIPSESGRWVIVASPTPGKYPIFAYTAIDGEPTEAAQCLVIVTGGPDPGPGPGPNPPPPPPDPVDPFTRSLQAAYDRDPPDCAGQPKAECKNRVLRLYRSAAVTDLENYLTAGELNAALKEMSSKLGLTSEMVPNLRRAIGSELKQVLPDDPEARLTQDHRANAKSLFGRLVKSLEVLK